MRKIQAAGFGLAVCVCAGVAFFATGGNDGSVSTFVAALSSPEAPVQRAVDVRVPAGLSIDAPQPIALDAALARRAVRHGELRVALPDGATYPIAIERHYTDKSGHWNVVGRADTQRGAQPMVLTFGPRAVFGTLPTPDGTLLRVVTQPRGRIAIAPAGGSLPPGVDPDDANDVLVPRIDATQGKRPTFASAAAQPERLTPDAPIAYPPVDTTPVDIDVLVAYTPEQVALRGDVEAVQAEIANLIAMANQAHIDSGSRVRFVLLRSPEFANGANPDTELALWAFKANPGIRDAHGDLAILLRPYAGNGSLCGMAFLPAASLSGTLALADWGFAIASADGVCSPYVFAHELGHGFGAMHERQASKTEYGTLQTGAYYFSYAYRTPELATLMSQASDQPWVPYFSNPAIDTCNGQACGVLGYADNVRTFNLMAPAIAQLQVGLSPGAVSLPDAAAVEPANGQVWRQIEVHINGRATRSFTLDVEVTGGTATEGVDYTISKTILFEAGMRSSVLGLDLIPDDEVEADETIELSISSPDMTTEIARNSATFTIIEPERREISGRIAFPAGAPAPTTPLDVVFYNADGDWHPLEMTLQPPNFEYRLKVPYGVQVNMDTNPLPAPFVFRNVTFHPEVRADSEIVWFPEVGMRVSGRMRAKTGMALPSHDTYFDTMMYGDDSDVREGLMRVQPPDYAFEYFVPRGWNLRLGTNLFMPWGDAFWNVTSNVTRDLVFGDQPTLYAWAGSVIPGQSITGAVWLEGTAPAGGVRFRCRTADDSAKAGSDYTAHESFGVIPAGQGGLGYCGTILTLPNVSGERTESFKLQIDQVTGAAVTNPIAPIRIDGPKWKAL